MHHTFHPLVVLTLLCVSVSGCDQPGPLPHVAPSQMSSAEKQQLIDAVAEADREAQSAVMPEPNITLATPPGWSKSETRPLPPTDHGFTVGYLGVCTTLIERGANVEQAIAWVVQQIIDSGPGTGGFAGLRHLGAVDELIDLSAKGYTYAMDEVLAIAPDRADFHQALRTAMRNPDEDIRDYAKDCLEEAVSKPADPIPQRKPDEDDLSERISED